MSLIPDSRLESQIKPQSGSLWLVSSGGLCQEAGSTGFVMECRRQTHGAVLEIGKSSTENQFDLLISDARKLQNYMYFHIFTIPVDSPEKTTSPQAKPRI